VTNFNWSPGIGDPTIGGWITVILYLLAVISCCKTAKLAKASAGVSQEHRTWRALSALFLALGINKQLDLQSALTEFGRMLARSQGWYNQRQGVQLAFIVLVAITCVVAALVLLIWARNAPAPTWLALIGTMLVLGFVLIRAASFHNMDRFLGERILGFRWNWVLEMGGISLVLVGSEWRRKRSNAATKAASS
jgi:uncharacterized membrane protein YbhN (UPF0104 family)